MSTYSRLTKKPYSKSPMPTSRQRSGIIGSRGYNKETNLKYLVRKDLTKYTEACLTKESRNTNTAVEGEEAECKRK